MGEIFNTTRQYINSKRYTNTIRAEAAAVKAQVTQALWFLAKWFYNLVAREAQCVNRVWVLASCKLAALIFTCIYLMVSAMTSYSSLTSRRIFVSRQHSTESDFRVSSMTKVFMKSCLFIVCKTMFTIGESQTISHANRTARTRTPICQSSQVNIWHRKILWSENADLKFNGASNKDGDGINKQRSRGNITQWISNAKVL